MSVLLLLCDSSDYPESMMITCIRRLQPRAGRYLKEELPERLKLRKGVHVERICQDRGNDPPLAGAIRPNKRTESLPEGDSGRSTAATEGYQLMMRDYQFIQNNNLHVLST